MNEISINYAIMSNQQYVHLLEKEDQRRLFLDFPLHFHELIDLGCFPSTLSFTYNNFGNYQIVVIISYNYINIDEKLS